MQTGDQLNFNTLKFWNMVPRIRRTKQKWFIYLYTRQKVWKLQMLFLHWYRSPLKVPKLLWLGQFTCKHSHRLLYWLNLKHLFTKRCSSRKYPYPPHGWSLQILRGRGVSIAKTFKRKNEAKLEIPGDGRVQTQEPSLKEVWIFFGTTKSNFRKPFHPFTFHCQP